MLGEVVSHIGRSSPPEELELFLLYSISNPIKPHIECFGQVLFHGGVEDAGSCRVIIEDRSAVGRLGVTELGEGYSHWACLLGGEENTSGFCFRRGTHNIFQGVAEDVEGGIGHRVWVGSRVVAKDIPRSCTGTGLG